MTLSTAAILRSPRLIRCLICAAPLFVLLWFPFALNASECPIEADAQIEAGVWLQQLESGIEIPVPDGMRITSFGSTTDSATGQKYDEIRFSGESDTSEYFFIMLLTTATYEKVQTFSWSEIIDEGQPIATGVCSLAGEELSYSEYEAGVAQRAIYANDNLLLKVYADDALKQLTNIIANMERY